MAEYRRVGRGGAGNYYSPADIEESARRARQEDLEAQRATSDSFQSTQPPSQPSQPQYTTTGRGGAGNLTTSPPISISDTEAATTPQPRSGAQAAAQGPIYYGRGGAGNYRSENTPADVAGPIGASESDSASRQRARGSGADWMAIAEKEGMLELREPEKAHLSPAR